MEQQPERLTNDTEQAPRVWLGLKTPLEHDILHGKWVHADVSVLDLAAELGTLINTSPVPSDGDFFIGADEGWADIEVPADTHLDDICRLAWGLREHGAPFRAIATNYGIPTAALAYDSFTDIYKGSYRSIGASAYGYWHASGTHDQYRNAMEQLPYSLRRHIMPNIIGWYMSEVNRGQLQLAEQDGLYYLYIGLKSYPQEHE